MVRLGDVCDMRSGGTPRRGVGGYYGGTIPWVTIADMTASDGVVRETAELITEAGLATIGNRLFEQGTVLLAMYGSVGKLAIAGSRLATNQAILGLRPKEPNSLDPRYLVRWLASIQPKLVFNARGVTQANISKGLIEELAVPLPPLAEQRRIADILDKAEGIRRKRKEAIALAEALLRSRFLEMFGDPVANPKGWPVNPLRDAIDRLDAGWSANGEARERTENEFGVLKVSAVTSGIFRAEEHKAVPASAVDRELISPRRGDLLFSRANTRELVAATCLVPRDEPRLFLPDKLWRIVPRANAATTPYLRFLLSHDRMRAALTKTATGTSGSMLNISMDKLRGLRAPFPPIDLQEKFATLVWKTLETKEQHQSALNESESLFNSLVLRAFSDAMEASE